MSFRCPCGLELHLGPIDPRWADRALALLGWTRGAGDPRCDRCSAAHKEEVS